MGMVLKGLSEETFFSGEERERESSLLFETKVGPPDNPLLTRPVRVSCRIPFFLPRVLRAGWVVNGDRSTTLLHASNYN